MISFKTYLTEARMAPLYHATNYKNIYNILKNGIEPRTLHDNWKLLKRSAFLSGSTRGVSSTRVFNVAKNMGSVVFVLDQQKLIQNYKIKPINYFISLIYGKKIGFARVVGEKNTENEFEEFIITDKPIKMKYVTKILISNTISDLNALTAEVKAAGIPVEHFTR